MLSEQRLDEAFNPVFAKSAELYEQVKRAADYGSECIDGQEVFYLHRQRKFRHRRYEFAIKFYAYDGDIRQDAIEVCWCEIPLEQLLAHNSAITGIDLKEYSLYLYDDEYLTHGSVLFANGRMLDFTASGIGEEFIVVMLHGRSVEDDRRVAAMCTRMVKLGRTKHTKSRVQRLANFVANSGSICG